MPETAYYAVVRELSDRLVDAQKGIRILDAVKWDDSVRAAFFAAKARQLPQVTVEIYAANPLGFDVPATRAVFRSLERDITSRLGRANPAGALMNRMVQEYLTVLDMLEARGTPAFSGLAQQLYGRADDAFHAGGPALADLAGLLGEGLGTIDESLLLDEAPKNIPTERAVGILQERLDRVFNDPAASVRVCVSDGILADAAAGADYIKLRQDAMFSERDLRVLEVHEGWVHVGTTLNGRAQPYCTFLSKGTPSTTITQEGLAVLVEIISLRSHPHRLRRITDRIRAIAMAENGADFLEVYRALLANGRDPETAYATCVRVFRGSLPNSGPFTKDLAYSRGFVLIYNFIRLAVRRGLLSRIPLLFCGKLTLEDLGTLSELVEQGLVERPRYLPPPVADMNALTAWMAYSNFMNRLNLAQIESDFSRLLA